MLIYKENFFICKIFSTFEMKIKIQSMNPMKKLIGERLVKCLLIIIEKNGHPAENASRIQEKFMEENANSHSHSHFHAFIPDNDGFTVYACNFQNLSVFRIQLENLIN